MSSMSTCSRSSRGVTRNGVPSSTASRAAWAPASCSRATTFPAALLDEAYAMLAEFFALPTEEKNQWRVPGSHGQTGYTGLARRDRGDAATSRTGRRCSTGAPRSPRIIRCARAIRTGISTRSLPESRCPASARCCSSSTGGCSICRPGSCASSRPGFASATAISTTSSPTARISPAPSTIPR